jgi:hypothetical protein
MSIYSKWHILNENPIKKSMTFFIKVLKKFKFMRKFKRSWTVKALLRKRNKAEDITPPDFKIWYKVKVTKHHGPGIKVHKSMEQNRKYRKKNVCICKHLVFTKNTQKRKSCLFNTLYWGNWISTHTRTKLDHYPLPYKKSTQNRLNS